MTQDRGDDATAHTPSATPFNIPVSELAKAMPVMSDRQFDDLVASIRTVGFDPKHPIVIWRGEILDGRHRARACEVLGIEPPTVVFEGDEEAAAAEVWKENVARRHFPDGHRAMLAARLVTVRLGDNQYSPDRADPGRVTREKAAELAGVSTRSLDRATELITLNDPEMESEVAAGNMGLQTAIRTARRRQKPPDPPASLTADASPPAFPTAALQPLRALAAAHEVESAIVAEINAAQDRTAQQILGDDRLAPGVQLQPADDHTEPVDAVVAAAAEPAGPAAADQWRHCWQRLRDGGVVLLCSADQVTPDGHRRVTAGHLQTLVSLGGDLGMIWPLRVPQSPQPAPTVIEVLKPA